MKKRKLVPIDELQSNLAKWFKDRHPWLQDAARRLLVNGSLSAADSEELTVLCKKDAGLVSEETEKVTAAPISEQSFGATEQVKTIRLESIADITGVNNLAPRKPLAFGSCPLTIIYGLSGSGKSGYMRILKRACGAKGIKPLHGNVFEEATAAKSCKINFTSDGKKKDIVWTPESGVDSELAASSLYDTDSAHVYVNEENEVTYEPPVLKLFRLLVEVCEKIHRELAAEIAKAVSSKPVMDAALASTASGQWYNQINRDILPAEVVLRCACDDKKEQELKLLGARLAEANPAVRALALRKNKERLNHLISVLRKIGDELSNDSFNRFLAITEDAKAKRQTASVDADQVFGDAPLQGVGSESWRLLWEQARQYSEGEAYKGEPFPYIEDNSKCPLCQQDLDPKARERFLSFEKFVKGNLERAATTAEKLRDTFFKDFTQIPVGDALSSLLDLAGLSDTTLRDKIETYCDTFNKRSEKFTSAEGIATLTQLPSEDLLSELETIATNLEAQSKAFDEDSKATKREELTNQAQELTAQKWLSQQQPAIEAEIERLKKLHILEKAQGLTHTRALSDKKADLAEVLVTEAFRERFDNELKLLKASRLKVKIESQTHKGQVFHQIKLKDAKQSARAGEILSEGEFRIVSIAAFLADVEGRKGNAPFVFDDPISSLDQPFEEATAERLVNLAKSRQVIVFTHRLSMMVLLEDAAKKQTVELNKLSVRSENWGAGEPDQTPIWAERPDRIISGLLGGRLAQAKKAFTEDGRTKYEPMAKEICSEIRIAVERMVEVHLLNDVVHRFRRAIQTQNRIDKLAKIKPEDCKFVDDFMTKYSRYEHSQSDETPTPPPDPDEIERDLNQIKAWFDEFKNRAVPTAAAITSAKSKSHAA
jgi:hypothetical protein